MQVCSRLPVPHFDILRGIRLSQLKWRARRQLYLRKISARAVRKVRHPAPPCPDTSDGSLRLIALQALLDSLAPGAEASEGGKRNPDQVRRISDKLGELLGEDAMPDMSQRNEKGEVCPPHSASELHRMTFLVVGQRGGSTDYRHRRACTSK